MSNWIMYGFFGFGAILTIVGILIFVTKKRSGRNVIKMFGAKFELSTPSLVIFVVGVMLMVFPFLGITPSNGPGPSANTSDTGDNQVSITLSDEPSFKDKPYSYWITMLEDNWWEKRLEACNAMYHFGPGAANAVPILINILETDIPKVRAEAALALSRIGSTAQAAIPSLKKVSKWAQDKGDDDLYLSTLEALTALGAL